MLGIFEVLENKRVLLKLLLLQLMKIHNVFYPNLLCKTFIDPLINQVNKSLPPDIIHNKEKWEIENIFNTKSHKMIVQYQVKWVD